MQDLIFVSLENWDEIWRRNQFLCAELACRFPERKILFVCPPRDLPNRLRRGKGYRLPERITVTVPGLPNITVTYPLKALPNTFQWSRRCNELLTRRHVLHEASKLGMQRPLLWINPMYAAHLAGRMGESALLYDITDDWIQASFPPRVKRLIARQDRLLCRKADMVIVCSEALEQSRRALCKKIMLLPNGVDAAHYRRVSEPGTLKTDDAWPSPVFGYTGTLHPDRIDARLVVALARAFPEGSVVLIGPDHLDGKTRALLTAEKNVYLVGPAPYACIPERMTAFDVCIVPHLESSFTESLNPIKLWEYLASGKPIVSANVAGFRDYGHLCRIASGPEAFAVACREALAEDGIGQAARMAEAAKHSWRTRVDCLLANLQAAGVIS